MLIPTVNQSQPATSARSTARVTRSGDTSASDAVDPDDGAEDATAADALTTGTAQPMQQAMNNLPDSRPDAVARGKALAADPDYPPLLLITKLAQMLIAEREPAAESEA